MNLFFHCAQLLQDAPKESQSWEGGGGLGVLVVLLVLLVGCSAGAWIIFKRVGLPRGKAVGQLEIVETRALGGRQFLVVARHGEEKFLLGVCPGRIDYLSALNTSDSAGADFGEVLSSAQGAEPRSEAT